jgi:hypothetical protein
MPVQEQEKLSASNGLGNGNAGKSSMVTSGIAGGVIGGLTAVGFFYLLYQSGINPIGKIWDFWIQAGTIAGSIYYYWKKKGSIYLHLWEGLIIGFLSTIVFASVYSLAVYLSVKYGDPGLMSGYINESLENAVQLREQTVDKFGIEAYQKMIDGIPLTTYEDVGWGELIRRMGVSLFMVPVIAMILRK